MKCIGALLAVVVSTAVALPTAFAAPAWCTENADANGEDLRELKQQRSISDTVETIAKLSCTSGNQEIDAHRAEIDQARGVWSKKLGMTDADWADEIANLKDHDGTFKADLSTKNAAQETPIDQFLSISKGFDGWDRLYSADVLNATLSETGRMAFIDYCLVDDNVAREDGTMPKWAVCWPDVEKFDAQKVLAEVKADTAHTGGAKMWLRFHALDMADAIKDVADRKAKLIKKDDTWQKVFDVAAKARTDWGKALGTNTKLLELASDMDSAAAGHSRKLLDGCEAKTEEALATALATIPSKTFTGMHDDRYMKHPGFAESAGPIFANTPTVYIAATAWTECHAKSATADYLATFLQQIPGNRGPRNAALSAVMASEHDFKFDDTDAKRLQFPSYNGRPVSRSGGAIMSAGGAVKKVTHDGDHLKVELETTTIMQEDCVQEHRTNHIAQIRDNGSVDYELICDKTQMVKHDNTWMDFKINPIFEKVLKPGVTFSSVHGDKFADVVAIWPKGAKTPTWILGATIK